MGDEAPYFAQDDSFYPVPDLLSNADEFEVADLPHEIEQYLDLEPARLRFGFRRLDGQIRLDLVVVNSRQQQSFLFRYETGHDKADCLRKMRDYVRSYRNFLYTTMAGPGRTGAETFLF